MIFSKYPFIFKALALPILGITLFSGSAKINMEAREQPFAPISLTEADSLMSDLSDREKIAQLFILRTIDTTSESMLPSGYLLNSTEDSGMEARLDQEIPLLIGFDLIKAEKDDALLPKKEEMLAAISNQQVVSDYVNTIGNELRKKHFNFVLGPSLDLYYNDFNPFTEEHSFSDTTSVVITYASTFVNAMKSCGVLTVAGSFPGIGNMERGYSTQPPIVFSRETQLYKQDLAPFKALVNQGLQSILMSNASIPSIDSNVQLMASKSVKVHTALREELGFNGLIWTEIASTDRESQSQNAIIQSLAAGSDIIIVDGDLESKINAVELGIRQGDLSMDLIEKKSRKIIQSKIWSRARMNSIKQKTSEREVELATRTVVSASLTLLRNEKELIPLKSLDTLKVAVIRIAEIPNSELPELADRYSQAEVFQIEQSSMEAGYAAFQKRQDEFNLVILLASPEEDLSRKRFGLGEHYQSVVERISYAQRTILVWKGNSKALLFLSPIPSIFSVIEAFDETEFTDDCVIQAIFGGRPITGKIKRKVGEEFEREFGIDTEKMRLAYGMPEEVGINASDLLKIDEIMAKAIEQKACPGGQVWFSKDEIVVMNKSYGHHTYENRIAVQNSDLYDLASITKIAASMAALMKLTQDSLFNLDYSLCDYLPEWVDTTAFMQMGMREIFAHQAGLPAFIPFYSKTVKKGVPRYDIYSLAQSEIYPFKVARELYIQKDQPDKMFRQIMNTPISADKKYLYSDIGYYFALRIIQKQSKMKLEDYLDAEIYKPLGMSTMTYRPLDKFPENRIAPTELDMYFRGQLVHGYVHDPGAAMLGGVGGHAGLFSNANDLGKLMQLYLDGGSYGGESYFDSSIVQQFTACQFCETNRRGFGFDKPLRDGKEGPSCGCTSLDAFGHQGFTGTVTWADPAEKVVYVFLSNRVYPNAENKKLAEMNVRTEIQKVFYQAIAKNKREEGSESQPRL